MKTLTVETDGLRRMLWRELQDRRMSPEPGDFSHLRQQNDVPLYSVTGAANCYAGLGFWLGDFKDRECWAERINSFQTEEGGFFSPSGPQHAAATAIEALNILGGVPRRPVQHLAPLEEKKLEAWLNALEWSGTHKDFWGGVTPVLASGFHSPEWLNILRRNVDSRLSPDRPLETWCSAEEKEPWRVISCIYHVTAAYDAAFLPYPYPKLLWDRIVRLDYDRVRDDVKRTICTDFDYAVILQRLAHQLPEGFPEFIRHCRGVLEKRYAEWQERRESLLSRSSIHGLFCYVVGWAVYQRILPECFKGPGLYDTLNVPWLFRLPDPSYLAED